MLRQSSPRIGSDGPNPFVISTFGELPERGPPPVKMPLKAVGRGVRYSIPLGWKIGFFAVCAAAIQSAMLAAQAESSPAAFLAFVRAQAAAMRAADRSPSDLAVWKTQSDALRSNLLEAWGGFPATPCALEPRKLGEIKRPGYRIEKIIFQTHPGLWMTANAYVPERAGKVPAVLAVHGHWRGAKQDPVVQARCIGLARLGYFVLAVDALGAGERGVGKALGEYHGEMTGATLLPVGLPLSGLQVYEKVRAVDYLLSRPEVDGTRIAITGASGGGNQTMYSAAWDARLAAAVPVCSVGTYQSYLGVACCICELVPGAMQFTEEWGVLGLVAPRALLVVNATRDTIVFSVGEAKKSLGQAQRVFDLHGRSASLKHAVFESGHAYSRPMREAMYGWMAQHLKREGTGDPIAELEIQTEDPELLRCFPGDSRPDDYVTIPRFAARQAEKLVAHVAVPTAAGAWPAQRDAMRKNLRIRLHGGTGALPAPALKPVLKVANEGAARAVTFEPEPGIVLTSRQEPAAAQPPKLAILLDLEGAEKAAASDLARGLRAAGWSLVTLDLRATGKLAWPKDRVGRAPDHTTAEWAVWIGRPLLGQWVVDLHRLLDGLEADGPLPREVALVGVGPAGVVATCAAALDERISRVVTIGSLASYVSDQPYENQRLGIMVPMILRDVGDIAHLAALVAPRPFLAVAAVKGDGASLDGPSLEENFRFTRRVYELENSATACRILSAVGVADLVASLR